MNWIENSPTCDYIPFLSSAVSAVRIAGLFQKCVVSRPPQAAKEEIKKNYTYLDRGSFSRYILLLVPILGNIAVGIHDYFKISSGQKNQPEKPLSTSTDSAPSPNSNREKNPITSNAQLQKPIPELLSVGRAKQNEQAAEKFLYLHTRRCMWMQIIDGRHHPYGPYVFDLGLNGGGIEPQFLKNAIDASFFAATNFHQDPNTALYKQIHERACKGFCKEGLTSMDATHGGRFRSEIEDNPSISFKTLLSHCAHFPEQSAKTTIPLLNKTVADVFENIPSFNPSTPPATVYFLEGSSPDQPLVKQDYTTPAEKIETLTNECFLQFNINIKKAETDPQKLKEIARFYQQLEWIHPFMDGQGRTDIIFLSWLLCKYGFNPPILNNPYYSSMNTLDNWYIYLVKGIRSWQSLQKNAESSLPSSKDIDVLNQLDELYKNKEQNTPQIMKCLQSFFSENAKGENTKLLYFSFEKFLPIILKSDNLDCFLKVIDYGLTIEGQKLAIIYILNNKSSWATYSFPKFKSLAFKKAHLFFKPDSQEKQICELWANR